MSVRIPLYRPEGFKDSDKWALDPNGELIAWRWNSLPGDFSVDEKGNIFHHCPGKESWSRVVRNGEEASNFFEDDKPLFSKAKKEKKREQVKSSGGVGSRYTSLYKGKFSLRKRKFKKIKYKNSRRRRNNVSGKKKWFTTNKKAKVFKRKRVSSEKRQMPISRAACQYCLTEGDCDNIYLDPQERHSCDFCEKCFNGLQLKGHVCGYCLYRCYRRNFCEECTENLGQWECDWRMKLDIQYELHPERCGCKECFKFRWRRPCADCGMSSHTAQYCPWRDDVSEDISLLGHFEWEGDHAVWISWYH